MTPRAAAPPEPPELVARIHAWLAEDPDPDTRAELEDLLAQEAWPELADRFDGTLEFGTAGLRGALGAGSNRMNRVVVTRAAAGLAAYLAAQGLSGDVVIGYDARHGSADFARDTAEVMSGAGFAARVLPRPLPTPVLAFAIRELRACAGVMVTASHNPPQDNGYKVYLGDGSQIASPVDAEIAAAIADVGALASVARSRDLVELVDEEVVRRYVATGAERVAGSSARDLRIVYTPLHGVGLEVARDALRAAGFAAPHVVAEQSDPDPDFPTVAFPNPEEPGAMDLALDLAARVQADLVVANDPDADRCAVAVPGPHGWQVLRGDEVGALLGDHLLRTGRTGTFAASIVSSSLLGHLAEAAGQPYVETLTGFKWIGRVDGLAFGYEEALGYCCDPARVRDKDGITALLVVCELAAALKAEGRTLRDRLDEIAATHGLHATDQLSVRMDDRTAIPAAVARLRSDPPTSLGGLAVVRVDDLTAGSDTLPPTDGLRLVLDDGARVVVRPSGTEPKLKCYLEVVVPVDDAGPDAARISAAGRLDAVRGDLRVVLGLG